MCVDPTREEVQEYAAYLGIDAGVTPQLLWVAKDALCETARQI